jgi:large subunit ribosomal protein L32e
MADTHEKKTEKKVVQQDAAHKAPEHAHKQVEPAPKAPVHGQEPAPKAPVHGQEAAHKAPVAKALADEIEHELAAPNVSPVKKIEARPAPKAEPKPAPKAAPRPSDKQPEPKAEPKTEAPAEAPSPATTEKASPAGEVEGEIVEEPEEKKAEKPKKKKGKKERKPHIKPELTAEVVKAMAQRRELKDKTPNFIRQEAWNYGRLGQNWRKPQGNHSKLRHHIKYRINVVSIGYGGPNASKGLHPSGFREVLVHHPLELDKVDPKTQAARIAHGVGVRKRIMIEQRAQRKGIRVLNEMQE